MEEDMSQSELRGQVTGQVSNFLKREREGKKWANKKVIHLKQLNSEDFYELVKDWI